MICYQNLLNSEYLKRSAKNSSYSMRSFARDLGLSQSFLSLVMNRKRKLSDEMAIKIAEKLKLNRSSKNLFVNLVRLEQISDPHIKKILQSDINRAITRPVNFKLLTEDVFNIISDWYYFAIIELTTLENFQNEPSWIAKKLKISVPEVRQALERLIRVGLLKNSDGKLEKTQKDYIFENVPSAAIRKHHIQTLEMAKKALVEQPMPAREFFTISFPMDQDLMAKAKIKIKEFAEDLMAEMQGTNPQSVYKIGIQLFRLDQETL